jgi:Glycosyl transferase 4-like
LVWAGTLFCGKFYRICTTLQELFVTSRLGKQVYPCNFNHRSFYEQMKKIIILANTSWNIHNFRRNILQMLLDAPFEVVVVTPIDAFLSFIQDFPNARHIPLKKLARKSINPLRDLQLANELIRIFEIEKPNIILNYTIKPNIIGGGALAS